MNKKVLLIEDDPFLQDMIVRKVKAEGIDIFSAINGEDAFKILEEQKIDLVILDLLLPGLDGFEVLKKIRADERFKDLPINVFSNLSEDQDIRRCQDLGINEFMVKCNLTLDELLIKIKKSLGK